MRKSEAVAAECAPPNSVPSSPSRRAHACRVVTAALAPVGLGSRALGRDDDNPRFVTLTAARSDETRGWT